MVFRTFAKVSVLAAALGQSFFPYVTEIVCEQKDVISHKALH